LAATGAARCFAYTSLHTAVAAKAPPTGSQWTLLLWGGLGRDWSGSVSRLAAACTPLSPLGASNGSAAFEGD